MEKTHTKIEINIQVKGSLRLEIGNKLQKSVLQNHRLALQHVFEFKKKKNSENGKQREMTQKIYIKMFRITLEH